MSRSDDLRRGVMLHPSLGRRYEHSDLTAHRHKSRRRRRLTLLVEKSVHAMVARYAPELGVEPEQFEDFAHEVGRRLRLEARPEWTLQEAEARAIALAEQLFEELGGGDEIPEDRPDGPG